MDYKTLNWEPIGYVREYLLRRLSHPLGHALDKVEHSRSMSGDDQSAVRENLSDAQHHLQMTLSLIKAWDALIRWKNGEGIARDEQQTLSPEQIPGWFIDYLMQRAVIKLEQTYAIHLHPEIFYESVILLVNIASKIGNLSHVMINDAAPPRLGVWLRIVFEPPEAGTYPSKLAILDRVRPLVKDIALQFALAEDLFEYNNCRISLQNNTRTGHQAFAVLLPVEDMQGVPSRKITTEKENTTSGSDRKAVPETNSENNKSGEKENSVVDQ